SRSQENNEALRQISEVGRYLQSYQLSILPHQQLQHLQKAAEHLQSIQNHFLSKRTDWSITAANPLKQWQHWIAAELQTIQQQADKEIPNPFRYGNPLTPDMGQDVFRGRKAIALQIEQLLSNQQQNLSIALLAPRRCGKSSMLKMLPIMLPDTIFVFYDLQDNAVDSVEGFFRSLAKRIQEQAYQDRGVKLSNLPTNAAFEAGSQWLEKIDKELNQTLLICIDEFERLPNLFPGTQQQLLQLMSLFRATIQHRQHIRLLVSGAAPFNELENIWNDNFISVQEVKLPHLDFKNSIELVCKPITNFPKTAIPQEVAEAIFERSNGQPYLLQAFAGITIEHLNNKNQSTANLTMLDAIEEDVMQRCSNYFRDVYGSAPATAQQVMQQLSHNKTCEIDSASQRWLKRRLLVLTDSNQQQYMSIPVFAHWVRKFSEDF
ncbi:MAG TPA: hypothetical protein EYH20_02650, partial [Leucothrix sp.]|nr:hypothetical protein [Leucothrix sp.]